MSRLFPFLRLMLAVAVAVVSVHTAVSQARALGGQSVQICAGADVISVTLDASGQPVQRPYSCPDCVMAGLATLVTPTRAQPPLRTVRMLAPVAPAMPVATVATPQPMARGPPALV
ncbi:MAG: hypothetical protein WAT09_13310 [Paracoccaceae bacterium]